MTDSERQDAVADFWLTDDTITVPEPQELVDEDWRTGFE
jgi:hypothetical protein